MPSFASELEQSLHRALRYANERRQEYATLEHLLLALLDDTDALAVMHACDVKVEELRENLVSYIEGELKALVTESDEDAKPTSGFQRVIQRAVYHVQSAGRDEVTGANVLVAIFAERESHAVYFLQEQEMTRLDAVSYISHGIAKAPGMDEQRTVSGAEEGAEGSESGSKEGREVLDAFCVDLNGIAVFEPGEQEMIRVRLSESLQAVVSQRLVAKKEGGRIAAMEIMLMTSTIRDCVRDVDRMEEITDLIAEGRDHYHSQTFDQHLMDLVKENTVDFQVAQAAANNPTDFDLKMNMFGDVRGQRPGGGGAGGTSDLADEMTTMMGG